MKFELIWSFHSRQSLREIKKYYIRFTGEKTAKKLIRGIIEKAETLENSQVIGQKEILLESKRTEFRYLIFKNHKIIYSIDDKSSKILIYDVFDCRQNPEKLENISEKS